ncbi:YgeY family selenium metabolism-linked hydrolase [Clostridium aestuarii]|uniref:YgeY family selenium metabolism-linked hydrolase n=1 Tax=Clostridium aestuarii TaxID=338193 RepID=A0ABT4CW55_9CLOT|nr:YgeY family selenium metabolism-linked hydrolase [Clostridium aestuarii]MCY6483042.1 YgeY family selenium metabolism-linked hydrolase [Clostridium aestuarii]
MKDKIKDFVAKMESEIIKFAQDIVRIKSYTGEEKEIAMFVKDKMIELGYDDVIVDKLGNVIGVIGNGETKILYDSHIDTVEVNDAKEWSVDPFGGEIIDGKIYGRGATDMKAGVAANVYAGYAIKKLGLDKGKTIYVSTSVMEEDYEGKAIEHFSEEYNMKPDYVIICEPSSLKLALGHKGRAVFRVDMPGVAAHGSAPEKGVNAIYKMKTVIDRVEELGKKFMAMEGEKGALALTKIESEAVSINAIPDKCSAYLDRRLVKGEDEAFIEKEMEILLAGTDATWETYDKIGKSWTGEELILHSFLPCWEIDKESKLAKASVEAFQELNEKKPTMFKWDFCTNGVGSAGKMGIPTIGFGPGDPKLAHTRDENCPISDIIKACEFYTNLVSYL